MKPFDIRLPTIRPPYNGDELLKEAEWQPYPEANTVVRFYPLAMNEERYRLYTIAADLLPFVLSGDPNDSPLPGYAVLNTVAKLDGLKSLEQRLLRWYLHLSPNLKFDSETAMPPCVPHVNLQ